MVADTGPESEHGHHRHTGHRPVDVVLGVSAVLISVISLFLAIQHGRVMERILEASTWPYVMVYGSNANSDGSRHLTLSIVNKGVGPAKIESVELFYQGVAQANPQSLVRAILKPSDPRRRLEVLHSDVGGTVMSAGEKITFVDLIPQEYSPEEYSKINELWFEVQSETCYCSVFDECWIADQRVSRRPVAVKSCPVPKVPFFH
jgi:hypothetical protein